MSDGQTETKSSPVADRRKRNWLIWLGAVCVLISSVYLLWTKVLYPHYPARYKLTIEVETPQGLKTGFSVIEPVYGWEPTLFGLISGVNDSLTGEAVFVNLGSSRNLVVTLTNQGTPRNKASPWDGGAINAQYLPMIIFDIAPHRKRRTKSGIRNGIEAARKAGPREVPLNRLPTTVTFANPADPKSIQLVDPRNLAAKFGSGYSLKRAIIELTDAPIGNEIVHRLRWLPSNFGKNLLGENGWDVNAENQLASRLGGGSFLIRRR